MISSATFHRIILAAAISGLPGSLAAHQFEDGYVERSLSVLVRNSTAKIEYAIGLNDATMRKFMQDWPDSESVSDETLPTAAAGSNAAITNPLIDLPEGELINDLKLIEAFGKIAAPHVTAGLQLSFEFNGNPSGNVQGVAASIQNPQLELVSATASPRHHVTLLLTWSLELPANELLEFNIIDENFPVQPGGVRYAFKTAGTAMLVNSNVEPIIIRAKRIDLSGMSQGQRRKHCRIESKIRLFER